MSDYAWFDRGDGRQVFRRVDNGPAPKRSHLPTPMISTDTMDAVEHPCDGKFYTSKAAFRATTKANGCIEMGNDPARLKIGKPQQSNTKANRESVERAFARIKA